MSQADLIVALREVNAKYGQVRVQGHAYLLRLEVMPIEEDWDDVVLRLVIYLHGGARFLALSQLREYLESR